LVEVYSHSEGRGLRTREERKEVRVTMDIFLHDKKVTKRE
jgi:hypothetical protein